MAGVDVAGDTAFFDLSAVIKRRFSSMVWIPLRLWDEARRGDYNTVRFRETFEGAHAILVPLDRREYGERYTWSDDAEARPWSEPNFYKPADVHSHNAEVDVGIRLVLRQPVADQQHAIWHLHQDLVIALGLVREGDRWVRPEEAYIDVVRLRKNEDGGPIAIEIRAEFLRDYLCARNAALRLATYRERTAVVANLDGLNFKEELETTEVDGGRLEQGALAIDASGAPYGSTVAVFHVFRTDVDTDDDVPVMGPETAGNTDGSSRTFARGGEKMWRVSAEFWRDEWIEPADASPRVRRDHVRSDVSFIVDADGRRMNADDLNDEDIGRWLWFSPGVVAGLAGRRGAKLNWYTRDTGGISTPSDPSVHFGLNESGLVTVYARDVARLPEWERRYWAGFNLAPEGKVSAELLASQVRAEPANTKAPEPYFAEALERVSASWRERFGTELLRSHDEASAIGCRIHRFRSLDLPGLLSLAKDVARLTADSIDANVAQKVSAPAKGEKRSSLKSLESALASICGPELAHRVMGPLFGVYELRLSDAHLPKSDMQQSFKLLEINEDDLPLTADRKLLHQVALALLRVEGILRDNYPGAQRSGGALSRDKPA